MFQISSVCKRLPHHMCFVLFFFWQDWVVNEKRKLKNLFIDIHSYNYIPVYSGKQIFNGDVLIFCSNRSFLFKNRIIDVSKNHLLLQIESNKRRLSCIRFYRMEKKNYYQKLLKFHHFKILTTSSSSVNNKS